jgi:hypothetical protein
LTGHLMAAVFFIITTVIITWPLAGSLGSKVRDLGDPLLNTWIIWWDVHALLTPGTSLFDAPMFHPSLLTIAYSEHMIVTALTAMPLLLMGMQPLTAYNLLFMLTFAASGFGAYLLGRYVTGSRAAGIIAGLAYAYSAFRFSHLGHLQILAAHFIPFALLYLHKWLDSGSWRHAAYFGLFWLLQILSCGYHALFVSLAIGMFLLFYGYLHRLWKQRLRWLQMIVVALVITALVIPLFLPYLKVKKQFGFTRDLGEVIYYSADLKSYAAAPPENRIYGKITGQLGEPEKRNFMGLTLSALAVLAIIAAARGMRGQGASLKDRVLQQRHLLFYLLLALLALWASLGPRFGLYYVFFKLVPGFDNLRVPSRLAVLVSLAWGALAAFGAARILNSIKRPAISAVIMVILSGLILAEAWQVPLGYANVWQKTPKVYQWLAKQQDDVVSYEIPSFDQKTDVARDARYLFWSIKHRKRMINGYSGYFPEYYRKLSKLAFELDFDAMVPVLVKLGATHLIWHSLEYPAPKREKIKQSLEGHPDLKLVWESSGDYVYGIRPHK